MNAPISLLLVFMLLFTLAACGDDDSKGLRPKGPGQVYATAVARINTTMVESYKLSCKCKWEEEGFESEAECLEQIGEMDNFAANQRCLFQVVDDLGPAEGDLEPVAQCHEETSLLLASCVSKIGDACTEESFDAWNDCGTELFTRNLSCMTHLDGVVDDWLDEFSDQMKARCTPD